MKITISRLLALQDLQLQAPSAKNHSPEIETLRREIPGAILERFDKFVVRGKKGVALVQNSVCRGCQMRLPVGVVNGLINGVGTQVCANCGRYLCLAPADAAAFQAGERSDILRVTKRSAPAAPKKPRARKTPAHKTVQSDSTATLAKPSA